MTDSQDLEARIHDFAHTGPESLAGRYMRAFWQPVSVSDDLAVGRARPLQIMGERYTLYRGESGTPRIVAERCAHRSTALSIGWVEGDDIRCRYHGWCYGGDGQCTDRPGEDAGAARAVRIASYPTREYLGLIFGYFGDGEAPPFPTYPEWEAEGVLEVGSYIRPCNFFNALEDAIDPAHATFTHRGSLLGKIVMPEVEARETAAGIEVSSARPGDPPSEVLFQLPNIRRGPNPTGDRDAPVQHTINWRVPIDDESHHNFFVCIAYIQGETARRYVERRESGDAKSFSAMVGVGDTTIAALADRVLSGELHLDELQSHSALISLQDTVVERGQGLVADHRHERLSRFDVGVAILRQIWERELRAIAEARPLTGWVVR
ncbi:MAG: Rieske 2Fe-2S domain-containing protein [Chloroflexota bacterium]